MRSWGVAAAAAAAAVAGRDNNNATGKRCDIDEQSTPSPIRRFSSLNSACGVGNKLPSHLNSSGPHQQKQQWLQHDYPTQQQRSSPQWWLHSSGQQLDRFLKQHKNMQQQQNYSDLRWQQGHVQQAGDQHPHSSSSSRRQSFETRRFNCCNPVQGGAHRLLDIRVTTTTAARQQQQQRKRRLPLLFPRTSDCSSERQQSGSSSSCRWLPHDATQLIHCTAAPVSSSNSSGETSNSRSSAKGNDSGGSSSKTKGNSNDATSSRVTRQQVLVWGSRAAFPGGAEADVMQPREVSWFADAARARGAAFTRLSFGPSFGVAVNSRGEAAIWGSFDASFLPQQQQGATAAGGLGESGARGASGSDASPPAADTRNSLCFAGPVFLKLPFGVRDAQCSAAEIFLLSDCGRVYFLEGDLLRLLRDAYVRQKQQQPERRKEDHDPMQRKDKENQQDARTEDLRADPVELEGLPVSPLSHLRPSWISSWLGRLLPYYSNSTRSSGVTKMSVGYSHAAFLTDAGELYMCGSNTFGECGVDPDPFDAATLHVRINKVNFPPGGLSQQQLQQSNQQQQQQRQRQRQAEQPFIVDVACGRRHTLCVSRDGEAYAFGDDSKIELGLGDTRSQQQMLVGTTWMERLAGRTAPTAKGASYSYADRHVQPTPQRLMKPSTLPAAHNCMATAVAAGDDFSVVLYEDIEQSYPDPLLTRNTLLCCGETALGQCGRGLQFHQQPLAAVVFPRAASAVSFNRRASPGAHATTSRHLEGPSLVYKVDKFRCGSSHCNALMSSGKLVGWGFNPHGQVGTGPKVKGPVSPAKIIHLDNTTSGVDNVSSSSGQLSSSSSPAKPATLNGTDASLASEEQLTPPLARFLRSTGAERFEVQDVFCKFDSSAVLRGPAEERRDV